MSSHRRFLGSLIVVAAISVALLAIGAVAIVASAGLAQGGAPQPAPEGSPPAGGVMASATGVLTQLGVLLDGSRSVDEWDKSLKGLRMAINDADFPKDGTIELTVIQFGAHTSRREIGPVVITTGNYADIRDQIDEIPKMADEGSGTPMACAFYRLADLWYGNTVSDTHSPTNGNGSWFDGDLAFLNGSGVATATTDLSHRYRGYGFDLPGSMVLEGIEVRLDAYRTSGAGRTGSISVELSWDGGSTWTATGYAAGPLVGSQRAFYVGGPTDTWGHTWTSDEINRLRVRVRSYATGSGTTVYLDWIPVNLYYHLTGWDATLKQAINVSSDGNAQCSCDDPVTAYNCGDMEAGRESAEDARDDLLTTLNLDAGEGDRICAEGLNGGNQGFNWMRDEIVWPQPGERVQRLGGQLLFPHDVGWMLDVETSEEFKRAILVKSLCQALEPQMTASPVSGCWPLEVTFTGTVSSGVAPYVFRWNFGDGTHDVVQSKGAEAVTTHVFKPGVYTVTLYVFDEIGCWGEASYPSLISSQLCLSVTKTDQRDPVCNTWRIRYTINLNNYGLVALHDVRVTDTLPAGTYFVSADMGGIGAYGQPTVTWEVDIPADTALPLHLEVGTSAALVGVATNRVFVFETSTTENTTVNNCPQPTPVPATGPWTCPRNGYADYAPHGLPDFNMQQDGWTGSGWTHAGPAASAVALWWLDSQAEGTLGVKYDLVTSYGAWPDHDPANVPPLVEDLAGEMATNSQGTPLESLQQGLLSYLDQQDVSGAFTVEVVKGPSAAHMLDEARKNDGVALVLLGFWQQQADAWKRLAGHWAGTCCVDAGGAGLEFADPFFDRAAAGFPGRSFGLPPTDPTVYNDAANVSYDHYDFAPVTVPGAQWGPAGYAGTALMDVLNNSLGMNSAADLDPFAGAYDPLLGVQVAADYAIFIRPVLGYPPELKTTVTLQEDTFGSGEDTYLYRYTPFGNYGTSALLKVGYKQTNAALVRFGLTPIPAGALIDSATLQVYAAGWGGVDITLGSYAVLGPWGEGEATWDQALSGVNWFAGGCNDITNDRREMPEDSLTTSAPSRWYSLNVTSLVQEWVDGTLPNNGVLLRAEFSTTSFQFASNEYSDVALRPKLAVMYH